MMTMGSLFDGIGGFPLAAALNGIKPLWASEIEAFPIEVTKIRFPEMLHVGDITKLDGATLPPVDIICGGSPCQDLSVAGQRAGLAGERSGLFMEQVRIAKEMRKADEQRNVPVHLIRPRYLVWENVPGAFSSAEGEDFRAVIEEIVRIKDCSCDVPRPESGRWQSAGAAILGDEFSLAWRVLDAQFWGVAQRRRRIFLVADFGGLTAPQILFEQDGLFGDTAEGRGQRQGAAASAQGSVNDTGGACLTPWDVQSRRIFEETGTWPSLYSSEGGGHGYIQTEEKPAVAFAANQRDEVRDLHDIAGAIQAQPGMKQQTFVTDMEKINAFHVNQRDEVIDLDGVSGALLATRNMQMQTFITEPLICLNDHGGERMDITEEVTPTLRAGMRGHPPLVAQPSQVSETMEITPAKVDSNCEISQTEIIFAAGVVSKGNGDCFITPEQHTSLTSGGGQAGQGYPCVLTAGFSGSASGDARGIGFQEECSPTLKTGTAPSVLCLNDQGGSQMHCTEGITGTLRAQEHGHQPLVMATQQRVLFENHAKDCRYTGPLEVAPTVTSTYGTGGNNVPLVGNPVAFSLDSKESNSMKSANPYSGCRETDVARTIDTTNPDPSKNQGGIAILQEIICIAGNTIDREPENGGNGLGCQPDISYTITTSDRHAVFSRQRSDEFSENNVVGTQSARQHKDATDLICQPGVFGQSQYGNYAEGCTTLRAQGGDNGGGSENLVAAKPVNGRNLIRRLTPLECERLQGFPDGWTLIPGASDSARYKALGNSVAIPCVDFVLRGIAYFLRKIHEGQEELPSCTSTPTT